MGATVSYAKWENSRSRITGLREFSHICGGQGTGLFPQGVPA